MGEEEFRLQPGRGNSVFGEVTRRGLEDGEKFHAAGAFSSRRRLRWSAARASTRSTSLPSITWARSCEVKPMRWSVRRFWGTLVGVAYLVNLELRYEFLNLCNLDQVFLRFNCDFCFFRHMSFLS